VLESLLDRKAYGRLIWSARLKRHMGDWYELRHWAFGDGIISPLVKVPYTLFVGILVPFYWRHYGPANFLWFSDIALFLTMVALWTESPLLASMQAVSITLLEFLWIVDFLWRLLTGSHLVAISEYMFKPENPLFIRLLSLFHFFLPGLLLWMVYRLGYDSRAWVAQTLLAWIVLLISYWVSNPSDNVNWVFGLKEPQKYVAPKLYLAFLMLAFSFIVYLPTHLVLQSLIPEQPR
jgi:hypothetical protein